MWGSHALREARHRRPGCADPVPSGFYKGMVNGVQWRRAHSQGPEKGKRRTSYTALETSAACVQADPWCVLAQTQMQAASNAGSEKYQL
jgi:hypothetical protein